MIAELALLTLKLPQTSHMFVFKVDTETDDAEETDGETGTGIEMEEEDTDCRITALKASYDDFCHRTYNLNFHLSDVSAREN